MLEIETKSLLGSPENAQKLREKIAILDPRFKTFGKQNQLNHYFTDHTPAVPAKLTENLKPYLTDAQYKALGHIFKEGKNPSIRTRAIDGTALLVVKASIDDTTSSNGISRIEFEEAIKDMTLDELDQILLNAGLTYQAKWSRERETYRAKDINITIDKNAGYGYVAEFEKIIDNDGNVRTAQDELRKLMHELEVTELPQDRLQRMFDYYNNHWAEYYGTDNIFNVS